MFISGSVGDFVHASFTIDRISCRDLTTCCQDCSQKFYFAVRKWYDFWKTLKKTDKISLTLFFGEWLIWKICCLLVPPPCEFTRGHVEWNKTHWAKMSFMIHEMLNLEFLKFYPTTINPKIYPTNTTNKNQSNNYQLYRTRNHTTLLLVFRPINQKMDIILSPEWMHSESSKKVMKPSWDLSWESTQTSDHKLQVPTPCYVCVMLVVLVALCPSETWTFSESCDCLLGGWLSRSSGEPSWCVFWFVYVLEKKQGLDPVKGQWWGVPRP